MKASTPTISECVSKSAALMKFTTETTNIVSASVALAVSMVLARSAQLALDQVPTVTAAILADLTSS